MNKKHFATLNTLFAAVCLLLAAIFAPLAGAHRTASAQEEKYRVAYITDCTYAPSLNPEELDETNCDYDYCFLMREILQSHNILQEKVDELLAEQYDLFIFEFMTAVPTDDALLNIFEKIGGIHGAKIMLITGYDYEIDPQSQFLTYVTAIYSSDYLYNSDMLYGEGIISMHGKLLDNYLEETARKIAKDVGEDAVIVVDKRISEQDCGGYTFLEYMEYLLNENGIHRFTVLMHLGGDYFYNSDTKREETYVSGAEIAGNFMYDKLCIMESETMYYEFRQYVFGEDEFTQNGITQCASARVPIYVILHTTDILLTPDGYPVDFYGEDFEIMGGAGNIDNSEYPYCPFSNKNLLFGMINAFKNNDDAYFGNSPHCWNEVGGVPVLYPFLPRYR